MKTPPINYNGRQFRSASNSPGGDVGESTVFHYRQEGEVVWASYSGGAVLFGTLVAKILDDGRLDMRYQHLGQDGLFKTGECISTPELLADGTLRLHEDWRWTSGAEGSGRSVVEEIRTKTQYYAKG